VLLEKVFPTIWRPEGETDSTYYSALFFSVFVASGIIAFAVFRWWRRKCIQKFDRELREIDAVIEEADKALREVRDSERWKGISVPPPLPPSEPKLPDE